MTDLLPIVFARGQNEGIDPRLAPPDVHAVAQNVRWRKDGRPAKRYGLAQITSTGLDAGGTVYAQRPVNFIGSWRGTPVLGLGTGIRRLAGGSIWSDVQEATLSEIPHFSPGRHEPIARSEATALVRPTVATANGYVLYAWDDGSIVYYQVTTSSGAIVIGQKAMANGTYARAVAVGSRIYVLYVAPGGTSLTGSTFDTTTLTFTANTAIGTLQHAGSFFDAAPRAGGNDWLVIYQSAAATLTVKLMSGANAPVATGTQTQATVSGAPGDCMLAVAGTSSSSIFFAWEEPTTGRIAYSAYNNAFTSQTCGPVTIEVDANNFRQPGIVIDSATSAGVFWGGDTVAAPSYPYLRYADADNVGAASTRGTIAHVTPCSKPFYGTGGLVASDGRFVWVTLHPNIATDQFADQPSFHLLRLRAPNSITPITAQMHVPGLTDSPSTTVGGFAQRHLADVVSDGNMLYTVLNPTLIRLESTSNATNNGIDSVSFSSALSNQRNAARDIVTAGRALQISGGVLFEMNGSTEESGFMHAPVITTYANSAGGSLTGPANYLYVAVFEWIDSQGRRHRSAPSDPLFAQTTGVNKTITLTISTLTAFARVGTPVIHIYRSVAGGATYHRITPPAGAPSASGGATAWVTYVDTDPDASIAANEFVYTDGGVVPNTLPPPCTFMCENGSRVWLGGQLDRNVITASKILVDGEPTQFSDEAEFSVFLPEECTGIAGIDGTVVAFARSSIYLVTGDGPNDQGIGSFSPPQKLPTDTGCIDWRSVLETSLGIFYQSLRGFFLLPRGFNTPLFIGLDVEDTVANFPICLSATLVSVPASPGKLGEITARFVMTNAETSSNSVVLVYDLRTQGWSVDIGELAPLGPGGTWSDAWVQSKSSGGVFSSLWSESNSGFGDNGNFIASVLSTGDVRPFGVAGYGGFDSVVVVGEYRGDSFVNVQVIVDGASAFYSFSVTSADASDGSVYLDVTPQTRMGSAIRVSISDTFGSPSEGFIAQAVFIEHETIGKTKRLAQARRA